MAGEIISCGQAKVQIQELSAADCTRGSGKYLTDSWFTVVGDEQKLSHWPIH